LGSLVLRVRRQTLIPGHGLDRIGRYPISAVGAITDADMSHLVFLEIAVDQ